MNYQIEKKSGESLYLQLYRQLRRDILDGVYPLGAKLPSRRLVAEQVGVSVVTVEHAYELLTDEGYVKSLPRSGFYAAFSPPAFFSKDSRPHTTEITHYRDLHKTNVTDRTPGADYADGADGAGGAFDAHDSGDAGGAGRTKGSENPGADFPFTILARTMRSVLSEYDRRILEKAPGTGCPELKNALASYLGRSRGLIISPGQIVIGSGAEYLYGLIAQLLGRGRHFALEDPSYPKIRQVYEANDIVCDMLPMGPSGIDSDALRGCAAGALHITPFHSYPSGVTADAGKRHEYAAWALAHDSCIIEDDYDSEFVSPTRQIRTVFSLLPERVIYVNTFSHTLAPSMRMGYMVLPVRLVRLFEEKLGFYSCTVPVFDQYVLAEFIEKGHLERHINRQRRKLRGKL